MEGMHLIEDLLQEKQLFDKYRSKRCLFWHTSGQKLKKIYLFSMEGGKRKWEGGNLYEFLIMLWPRTSPSDFHKTSEDPNCLIRENQCKNNNQFGRHASNGPTVERNFAS